MPDDRADGEHGSLSWASTDALIAELANRHRATLICLLRHPPNGSEYCEPTEMRWSGGFIMPYGLAHRAVAMMTEKTLRAPTEDED